MLIVLFLVSHFNFWFVPCGGLSWLPVSFLLHVKYTVSYRIERDIGRKFIFFIPLAFDAPVREIPVGVAPPSLVWKN